MTIYIIDTNLLFSATLTPESDIAKFIFLKMKCDIELLAPEYLKDEMTLHFDRLTELKNSPPGVIDKTLEYIYDQIIFIKDKDIPIPHYARAAELVREIDDRDLHFVALSSFADEYLLTGDLKLYKGLLSKGYSKVITFQQLKEKHNIE